MRLAWSDAVDASIPTRRPYVRDRLSMIRHLDLEIGPLRAGGFGQHFYARARPEVLEAWRPFIHPEPDIKSTKNLALDFPALQDLYLDFSALRLDAIETIFVG